MGDRQTKIELCGEDEPHAVPSRVSNGLGDSDNQLLGEGFENKRIIEEVEAMVKNELKGNDGSHDFEHVDRVRRLALKLARESCINDKDTLFVVELAALLHDIKDHKYVSEKDIAETNLPASEIGAWTVRNFLNRMNLDLGIVDRVVYVVNNVSWSKQQKRITAGDPPIKMTTELAIVQDADRLDAIGATGIARCLVYGGCQGRMIYTASVDQCSPSSIPTKKVQVDGNDKSSIGHFFDKLLKIKNFVNTEVAIKEAEIRHRVLENFVKQLRQEVET